MLFIQILTRYFITLSLLSLGFSVSAFGASASQMLRSAPALTANDLVVIVNEADPLSVRIADYYGRKRGIPDNQIVRVRFNPSMKVMKTEQFEAIKAEVDAKTPAHVQAF
ncbi:MAG: TIGR03790 family protein, partial [Gammaproteobacteria bacterium HGW-Gammaproteobacteria-10]